MHKICIKLNNKKQILELCEDFQYIKAELDIGTGRYVVDAKSVLGFLTLDISRILILTINTKDENVINDVKDILKKYNCIINN